MSNAHQHVTDQVRSYLAADSVPWREPYEHGWPINQVTGHPYLGINAALLMFKDRFPRWATAGQWLLACRCQKGDVEPTTVYAYEQIKLRMQGHVDEYTINNGRTYQVYNITDLTEPTEPIDMPASLAKPEIEDLVERLEQAGVKLQRAAHPSYTPSEDAIGMPDDDGSDDWVYFFLHEAVHATGHPDRASRAGYASFHDVLYTREELVAELGAMLLARRFHVQPAPIADKAYIRMWDRFLRNDPHAFVYAAIKAQKATDWLLGETPTWLQSQLERHGGASAVQQGPRQTLSATP